MTKTFEDLISRCCSSNNIKFTKTNKTPCLFTGIRGLKNNDSKNIAKHLTAKME